MRPAHIYWCDACRFEDSVFGASHAHCQLHGTIYEPIGCMDFEKKNKPLNTSTK